LLLVAILLACCPKYLRRSLVLASVDQCDAGDCNKRNVTTRQKFVQSKMKLVAEQYEKNSDS